jgi:hypothetical protein
MAHTCNPSYLLGRDQEYQGLRPAQVISTNNLVCHPGYVGSKIGGSLSRLAWAKTQDPIQKITEAKRVRGMFEL